MATLSLITISTSVNYSVNFLVKVVFRQGVAKVLSFWVLQKHCRFSPSVHYPPHSLYLPPRLECQECGIWIPSYHTLSPYTLSTHPYHTPLARTLSIHLSVYLHCTPLPHTFTVAPLYRLYRTSLPHTLSIPSPHTLSAHSQRTPSAYIISRHSRTLH